MMKELNRQSVENQQYPAKIMQFGQGNFLRGFVDWQIDVLNAEKGLNAGIVVIKPRNSKSTASLNIQDGLFTTVVRGLNEDKQPSEALRLIDCINEEISVYQAFDQYMDLAESPDLKLIFSNTTESGIEYNQTDQLDDSPASTFPAKLTQWLYRRFNAFSGEYSAGMLIVPCELIDDNGEKLKEIVLKYCQHWQLEDEFIDWLEHANHFCSTLVDRIVTGYPTDDVASLEEKLGYRDQFLVAAEYYHLFVIKGPKQLTEFLGLNEDGSGSSLNIKIVDDITPYKQRKVAILNGAHTALTPLAYMSNIDSVGEALNDELLEIYLKTLISTEIIPTLDLPQEELSLFADEVLTRFKNPYIRHLLIAISVNSMTKFSTRLIPQLHRYVAIYKEIPPMISLAIAGQILFYRGLRDGKKIPIEDNRKWLELFAASWSQYEQKSISLSELVNRVLTEKEHWKSDLSELEGLANTVESYLRIMLDVGVENVLKQTILGPQ